MEHVEHLRRPASRDQCVVLLAEDDPQVRDLVRAVLSSEGFLVLAADNGQQALELSQKYPGQIHLLLSDVRMPIMDGMELKEKIIRQRPEIQVMLMSGEVQPRLDTLFLPKPFAAPDLRDQVIRALRLSNIVPPCTTRRRY